MVMEYAQASMYNPCRIGPSRTSIGNQKGGDSWVSW